MDVKIALEQDESFDSQRAENHMFLSIASLSDIPGSVIAGLAFIVLDPRGDGKPETHYSRSVDWDQEGRSYSFGVIRSWMGRSEMARRTVAGGITKPVQIVDALRAVVDAAKTHSVTTIWSTAPDLTILRNALDMYKIDIPWPREAERDAISVWGTITDLGLMPELERGPTEPISVPLGDAAFMARGVALMYRGVVGSGKHEDKIVTKEQAEEVRRDTV